jgi:SAM-dependent methyltransferase
MVYSPLVQSASVQTGIQWDEPDCPLCGGDRRTPVVDAPDPTPGGCGLRFAVVRCDECGLHFTSPRPDRETIGQFYPSSYRPFCRPRERDRSPRFRRLAAALGRTAPGRLLDFGCGSGGLLDWAARQGWSVTGLDVSADAVEAVRSGLGVRVFHGTLPHPALPDGSFDVVTMWHALEHVHDPLAVLTAARRLLAPGGRLLIAVPNIASTAFRWFGPSWFGLDLPRHLTHFTPPTLRRMLERAGFQVVAICPDRHADWMRSSAKLAGGRGPVRVWQRAMTYKPGAKLAAWGCHLVGRSDGMIAVADA